MGGPDTKVTDDATVFMSRIQNRHTHNGFKQLVIARDGEERKGNRDFITGLFGVLKRFGNAETVAD